MPKESLNLYIDIRSGSSERTLTSLADKTRALDKETQLLQQATDGLAKANESLLKEQTRLQSELRSSQKVVNDLQKAYDEYGDEMMKLDLDQAIANHSKLKEELTEVNAQLGSNQKTYKEYLEVVRKGEAGGGLRSTLSGASDFAKGHFYSELMKPLFSAGGEFAEALLTSAIGIPEASLISGIASNALSGAGAGAMFGLPGIAIGTALGGASGLISGGTKIFEAKDDAFKDYYGGLYEDVKNRSGEMVEAGTSLASTRETNRISFTTLFDGDEDRARGYLEELTDMANSTPFLYDDLVSMSKTLATYGYDDSNILPLLQTIGDTGAALGMSTSDMNAVAQALGRMKSSDRATREWLDILNDRGIGAVSMLADAYGVSQKDMYGKISKGEISGTDAVEIITAALARDKKDGGFAGSMAEQSQTFAGISSTLEGLQQNLNALGGEGYNTLRQSGKEAEVHALSGDLGDAIGEINAIIGENQARKENLQEQYMREVQEAVLEGKHGELWDKLSQEQQDDLSQMGQAYAQAKQRYEESGHTDWEAGAEIEKLYEATLAAGESYFANSAEAAMLNDKEIEEIALIRENTAGLLEAAQNIYRQTQELSKGYMPVVLTDGKTLIPEQAYPSRKDYAQRNRKELPGSGGLASPRQAYQRRSHAFGLERVPYDEYPALLHRDERVLTAAEARSQDGGRGSTTNLTVTGNSFMGVGEELADQLFEIIARKLEQAAVAAAPK